MNNQELIERIEGLKNIFGNKAEYIEIDAVIELISKLDEPEAGHADEAPRYVKNVLARLRELPLHNREVWLKAIMGEFEQEFSHAKWREGYEQGKFEGMVEREKVTIPQFVADWIEYCKVKKITLAHALYRSEGAINKSVYRWIVESLGHQETFARAWLDGYEVEKERKYIVTLKSSGQKLYYHTEDEDYIFSSYDGVFYSEYHTKTDLEENGMSWIFDCEGVEVQEVQE
ncbi:hypothetical protein SNAG_0041 [Streptococcus sp. NPS 308]|uniref:DUF1642 domain-containing protein n=1 Tax=Streptococcus sp. NPS 308 TaxID=1902136 RepID=UPI000875CFE7|nr:DUF1642 domain-containing protein [Streptococcus sp. NPS 308]BAV78976.1 hypothetical protein SNAG_0041 [Streptococcus sp. NPS 308]